MMQHYIYRLFTDMDGQIYRIQKSEYIKVWKVNLLLILASFLIYIWMAWIGMGTNHISKTLTSTTPEVYNTFKFWFVIGRSLFGVIFATIILFLISYYFYLLTKIPYKKLIIMQQVVLIVMLFERLLWIPFFVYLGLDWYVSPFSLGIIAAYFTENEWFQYFFGAITVLQIWIIAFQVKYLSWLSSLNKRKLWSMVLLLHLIFYVIVATSSYIDEQLLVRWIDS